MFYVTRNPVSYRTKVKTRDRMCNYTRVNGNTAYVNMYNGIDEKKRKNVDEYCNLDRSVRNVNKNPTLLIGNLSIQSIKFNFWKPLHTHLFSMHFQCFSSTKKYISRQRQRLMHLLRLS